MMIRFFLSTLIAGLAGLAVLNNLPLASYADPAARPGATCGPSEFTAEAKMEHLLNLPPQDVVLLGNSRILAASQQDIGRDDLRVFNLGIGGSSFRQSVVILREMIHLGRAPRLAIMAFDHPAIGNAQHSYFWPPPPRRWFYFISDLHGLITTNGWAVSRLGDFFYSRLFHIEPEMVSRFFSARWAERRVEAALPRLASGKNCGRWLDDGSRAQPDPSSDLDGRPPRPLPPQGGTYPLLNADLRAIADLRDHGVAVAIYVTPLHASIAASADRQLQGSGRQIMEELFSNCRSLALPCHLPPELTGGPEGHWLDETHPPAAQLGKWLANLIALHLPADGAVKP